MIESLWFCVCHRASTREPHGFDDRSGWNFVDAWQPAAQCDDQPFDARSIVDRQFVLQICQTVGAEGAQLAQYLQSAEIETDPFGFSFTEAGRPSWDVCGPSATPHSVPTRTSTSRG